MSSLDEWLFLLFLSLTLTACSLFKQASPNADGDSSGVSGSKIVVSELPISISGMSAYELVNRYKPLWLERRGPDNLDGSPAPVKVYLDDFGPEYGIASVLRKIRAFDVASIRHFDKYEAQMRFGSGNLSGAILVNLKTGEAPN
jgi:hypothetical protein